MFNLLIFNYEFIFNFNFLLIYTIYIVNLNVDDILWSK